MGVASSLISASTVETVIGSASLSRLRKVVLSVGLLNRRVMLGGVSFSDGWLLMFLELVHWVRLGGIFLWVSRVSMILDRSSFCLCGTP